MGINSLAQYISQRTDCFIGGGFAMSTYYKHRLPRDLDVWGVDDYSVLGLNISEEIKQNDFLTKVVVDGVSIDFVSKNHELFILKYAPVYAGLVRLIDKKDLAASLVHKLINRPTKTSFYDLYCLLLDYKACEIRSFFFDCFPSFIGSDIAKALTNFDLVENSADALLLDCCGGWENVKSVITQKVRACLG